MKKDNLIASIFSSAVKTSLSECKSTTKVPPKKKLTPIAKTPTTNKEPIVEQPNATTEQPKSGQEEWIEVPVKTTGKSGLVADTSGTVQFSAVSAGLDSGSVKTNTLTSNAFYLPRKLEKHLHKASGTTKKSLKQRQHEPDAPLHPTKAQSRNQRRAKKRAKKRVEQEKAALLQTKQQALVAPDEVKAHPKEQAEPIVSNNMQNGEKEHILSGNTDDNASQVGGTFATPASSLELSPSSANNAECHLLALPYEVLTNGVLSFLRPEEMSALGACSKYAKNVSEEGYLWQSLFRQRFPSSQLTPMAMKEWRLAYQLSLTKIVDRLRCATTHKTFMEDVLGVMVNFTVNPKTGLVDYIELSQDLVSETAFVRNRVREDVFGNTFKLFLPLYFSEEHFQRALPQIQKTILQLARKRKERA